MAALRMLSSCKPGLSKMPSSNKVAAVGCPIAGWAKTHAQCGCSSLLACDCKPERNVYDGLAPAKYWRCTVACPSRRRRLLRFVHPHYCCRKIRCLSAGSGDAAFEASSQVIPASI